LFGPSIWIVTFAINCELVGLKTVTVNVAVCPCCTVAGAGNRIVGVRGDEPVTDNDSAELDDAAN